MPLVSHNDLPTFNRLRQSGLTVLGPGRALHQDIRELHIGLLNMMPDAALEATERQFFRLVGESNPIAQLYVHPFTLKELKRGEKAARHIETYYETFEQIQNEGLDCLIITGAMPTHPELDAEPFYLPLEKIIDWAFDNVTSTLCSCLATHMVMQARYGQKRCPLGYKRWGVFPHRVVKRTHPLVNDVNTLFNVPHSRYNEIHRKQFEEAGLHILVESEEAGVHLAVSSDGFRIFFFQGHPEYDLVSLLKEYKRDVMRYASADIGNHPPFPDNVFSLKEQAILDEYRLQLETALQKELELPAFPEALIVERLDNTWHDTAESIIANWIGLVYQITHRDRKRPFMDGIDPSDPLRLGLS